MFRYAYSALVSMDVRIYFFLLMVLATSAHAQETISEEQILLNGYVDNSGKVLLTGYATPESLSYMSFLNGTRYTFDNTTNQLYTVTDMLTSKSADTWSLNFSLQAVPNPTSMIPKQSKKQQKNGFIF